ncbi:MAG: hypothetical protein E7157_02255 [Lactobacillales bacterium]|nr:hypothetical protein [Lactobacillales bacterium]
MEENINALDEISKGACMGMDATRDIIDKIEEKELKRIVEDQYQQYEKIKKKIDDIYGEYSDSKPHETGAMTKAMTWSQINMKTMNDTSTSKIAELLLQGTNMGIIEGRKILNNKNIDKKIHKIIEEYVEIQEKYIEKLKKYL